MDSIKLCHDELQLELDQVGTHTHTHAAHARTHAHTHTHTSTHTHSRSPFSYMYEGSPEIFSVQVRPANNFPIDLYLLMDLSFSMSDDLANLKQLGTQLGMYQFSGLSGSTVGSIHMYVGSLNPPSFSHPSFLLLLPSPIPLSLPLPSSLPSSLTPTQLTVYKVSLTTSHLGLVLSLIKDWQVLSTLTQEGAV